MDRPLDHACEWERMGCADERYEVFRCRNTAVCKNMYTRPRPPPREAYVRVGFRLRDRDDTDVIIGIEIRPGEALEGMKKQARRVLSDGWPHQAWVLDDLATAESVETKIKAAWPDRAYFIEVGNDLDYVQIFQPWRK